MTPSKVRHRRKVFRHGKSLAIVIPRPHARSLKIKCGEWLGGITEGKRLIYEKE